MSEKFTYPFRYTPHPLVREAAQKLIAGIDADPFLREIFSEGKMMGVLMVEGPEFLYAFSGNAGGRSTIDGFVPPIFDLARPDGEYRRREAEISALNRRIASGEDLKELRKKMSEKLQDWIFGQYRVHNAIGECSSIKEIFAAEGLVPPGGTGECAAPKLLEYAYRNKLKPLAMGEFWYGKSPLRELRQQGAFYPSCTGKCGPLLRFMLKGLDVEDNPLECSCSDENYEILMEDDDIIVAVKPHGMLSVPGKSGAESLLDKLRKRCGCRIFSCHRLDMDTSGLMVYAKNAKAQADLQRQFENRIVDKEYIAALVPGNTREDLPDKGEISLPLALDYYDRPRQMVDYENGKPAVTQYRIDGTLPGGSLKVRFKPLTGRSHQLRVHSAHPLGLGLPIKGDALYGGGDGKLCLQAYKLSFNHPSTGKRICCSIPEEDFSL